MTRIKDARVHCVVLNIRSAPALPHHNGRFTLARRRTRRPNPHHHSRDSRKPGPSGPNNVHQPAAPPRPVPTLQAERTEVGSITPNCTVNVPPMSYPSDTFGPKQAPGPATNHPQWATSTDQMLLRKEVIQPHLPVRLPCYDLVLITDPTFDGSFHKG